MKIQILQENLIKALSISSKFCSSYAQLPILSNILLQAKKNKLFIKATNLEMSISFPVGAKTEKEGELTIPVKAFHEMVGNMGKGQIALEVENENVKVSSGKFSANLMGMNSKDYPIIPEKLTKNIIKIDRLVLNNALKKVLFAVSVDETRPTLTGILFKFEKKALTLAATDGFRLSIKRIVLDYSGEECKFIVPRNILSEIVKIESENPGLELSYDPENNQILFLVGDIVLSSRVIAGDFPDYEKIIPVKSECVINTEVKEFENAVKLASVFSRESSNTIKIRTKENSLMIFSESQKYGSQENEIEAKIIINDKSLKLEIAYNYKFILDFLGCIESDEITIELNDSNSPGKFIDSEDREFLHLIMPIKI